MEEVIGYAAYRIMTQDNDAGDVCSEEESKKEEEESKEEEGKKEECKEGESKKEGKSRKVACLLA